MAKTVNIDYDKQAQDFLSKTNTKLTTEFIEYGIYFDGDKDKRDIYKIALERGTRKFSFRFGQSIKCSGRFWKYGSYKRGVSMGKPSNKNGNSSKSTSIIGEYGSWASSWSGSGYERLSWDSNRDFKAPTAYDALASLQAYDCGSLDGNLKMLYTDEEMELLSEIQ